MNEEQQSVSRRKLRNDDYTVGWICAIRTEYVAAQAFLDEEHEIPESIPPRNNSVYTLGAMGKHNIIIVAPPMGEYGIATVSGVARDMLNSFPNVRIGLLVGIGGGAPNRKHDIRLGDIVVSIPRNGKSGVLQYDFGKMVQNQKFQNTMLLDQPPGLLRAAVTDLAARYEREGHQLEDMVSGVIHNWPRLRKKFRRPDSNTDRLYRNDIVHPAGDERGCVLACGNNPSTLVIRPKRTEEDDNPTIHYGIIASANQVMKDASIRDKLSAENDVLCFEMEAAGLMNQSSCLVIRGICDYSDTHKNDEWQGYAAMAAAAYAKSLLGQIPPTQLQAERRISDVMSSLQELNLNIRNFTQNMDLSRLTQEQNDQLTRKILDWLSPVNYTAQHSDHLSKHHPGTARWFMESLEFQNWVTKPKQTLYCPGIPGAGKTTLTSVVIDELDTLYGDDNSVGIAYIYFSFSRSHEQRIQDILASLLKQLVRKQLPLPDPVKRLYDQHHDRGTRPMHESLSRTLGTIAHRYEKVFIIIDALDECYSTDACRDMLLSEIFSLQSQSDVRFLATSRSIPEIMMRFDGKPSLEVRANHHDVQTYIKDNIGRFKLFVAQNDELQNEIIQHITDVVDGMFLLARLHLESLISVSVQDPSVKAIRKALERLPSGSCAYDSAYQDAMQRIRGHLPGQKDKAYQVLAWISRAKRQLTAVELQHALAVELGTASLDEDNLYSTEDIVSFCAGLVVIDKESTIIRLVHHTAQEYPEKTWTHWFPNADGYIATVALTYLNYNQFSAGPAENWSEYWKRLQDNCLYKYAARYWGYHARNAYPQVRDLASRFLRCDTQLASNAQVLLTEQFPFSPLKSPEGVTGLHIAAYFGINEEVVQFQADSTCPDVVDGSGQTVLHWAVRNEQVPTVELLLRSGLDVNARDAEEKSPLHYAARQGNCPLIQTLIKKGALTEAQDINGQTPLLTAAAHVKVAAAKELLSHGAMANSLDNEHRNALHLAILGSKVESPSLVEVLLSHGTHMCLCDVGNMTPLHYAVGTGSHQIIDSLLQNGVDINLCVERKRWTKTIESGRPVYREKLAPKPAKGTIKGAIGLTPLHFAACTGHRVMADYLLQKGADPNARCHNGDTPLHIALREGLKRPEVGHGKTGFHYTFPDDDDEWTDDRWRVEFSAEYISDYEGEEAHEIYRYIEDERLAVIYILLANTDLDVNVKNADLNTPLHTVKYDRPNSNMIVDDLLKKGADVLAHNFKGQTALHLACKAGASSIACTFLDRGCHIGALDIENLNALHHAVRANQHDTVRIIFERDIKKALDLCLEADTRGRTLMHHHLSAPICSTAMLEVLLDYGADIDAVDQEGNTPLSLLLRGFTLMDRTNTCRFLLKNGADALWFDSTGLNLAHLSMQNHTAELGVLQSLSEYGVDLAAKDNSGKSILHHGAIHGSLSSEILVYVQEKSLLKIGEMDRERKTPLLYASKAAEEEWPHDMFAGNRWKSTLENLQNTAQA
ncbi:hypothetical protein Plec18170_008284 [Paecilomyces lecythidis]